MPSSCKELRAALASCLQSSDCILISRHTPLECLSPPLRDTLPVQCQQLQRGFRDCKRGMIDMRKRFRGNQPVASSGGGELEGGMDGNVGGGAGQGIGIKDRDTARTHGQGQLYAGSPAFEPVKGRSGDEVVVDLSSSRGL